MYFNCIIFKINADVPNAIINFFFQNIAITFILKYFIARLALVFFISQNFIINQTSNIKNKFTKVKLVYE